MVIYKPHLASTEDDEQCPGSFTKGDSLTYFQIVCEDNKRKTVNRKRYFNFYFLNNLLSVVIQFSECLYDSGNKSGKIFQYGKHNLCYKE